MQDGKEINKNQETYMLPIVALRDKTLFPNTLLNFDAGRKSSIKAIETAKNSGSLVLMVSQINAFIDNPKENDILKVGVSARIKSISRINEGLLKVSVQAVARVKIVNITDNGEFMMAEVVDAPFSMPKNENKLEAYFRVAKTAFLNYAILDKRINKEIIANISTIDDANVFINHAMNVVSFKEKDVQNLLKIDKTLDRVIAFNKLFEKETEISLIEKKIANKVRDSIDKNQKEFYLREQLKAIHEELEDEKDANDLTRRIKEKKLPAELEAKALKEVSRLDKLNPSSPDYSIILNYLDTLLELPFNVYTEDTKNLSLAKEVLDKDHFGLEKVKERIVEYLAVLHLTGEIKGPILCFVGPPGVGKTSVATSIARALNRKFIRMSLGGVKDEAEIRGHRKTYVGAMPGRIITGIKNAGSMNPVFLLDEIDKLSSDLHGDPASALLEVLDPEQNTTFRDRFMEVPFDLSKVMFITTANSLDTIPVPLLDRMEVIEINGYTDNEKIEIAKRYLIPKQLKLNGLSEKKMSFTDQAVSEIIDSYTMEAGVRNLEREIASVVRKVASKIAEHPRTKHQVVDKKDVFSYLGVKKRLRDRLPDTDEIGTATGLAWTSIGGTTLSIEVSLMKGKGEILLTGKLGDVMKESARTAISYIRAHAKEFSIDSEVFEKTDIHIHVPEGATPKDGPSAGITMATALLSAFTSCPVKKNIAMTGEITLRGRVLAIGGLKEKALAAYRQGITDIIIPLENQKDLVEIPKEVRNKLNFITVKHVDEVFKTAIIFKENK